ncbi:hypothetical protein ACF2JD_02780 [Aeromonas sp. A-5]|uniref:hypothetical protein n=1 Tax=Aeromonas ichthyocola TaxID=3367746 RepID=UPI0038D97D0B
MKSFFITGTDTDVGKTLVARTLLLNSAHRASALRRLQAGLRRLCPHPGRAAQPGCRLLQGGGEPAAAL